MNKRNRMNAAQAECLALLDAGWDWADAQHRAAKNNNVDADDLQAWYDQDDALEAAGEARAYSIGR